MMVKRSAPSAIKSVAMRSAADGKTAADSAEDGSEDGPEDSLGDDERGEKPAEDPAAPDPEQADPESVDSDTSGSGPAAKGDELDRRLLSVGAIIIAVIVMGSGLFAWWHTASDDSIAKAQTRDAVLITAQQDIKTLNTLDYRQVDKGLDAWRSVTTGTLHDQLNGVSKDDSKLLSDQKKITTGKVVAAAVTDLDGKTATVIASVEVTVKDDANPDAKPTVKRNRFSASMKKVDGDWKLENLQQVAVNLS